MGREYAKQPQIPMIIISIDDIFWLDVESIEKCDAREAESLKVQYSAGERD